MTKQELQKIIQEAVRREVKKEIKKIFIKEETNTQLKSVAPQKPKPNREKHFTKNKSLNKALNETVGLINSENQSGDYPTLSGGTFDSSRMSELMGYGRSEEVQRDMVAVDTLQKAGKSLEEVPEHVTNALTRDYSGLMKAMDKKG
jgi:hypothetical protein